MRALIVAGAFLIALAVLVEGCGGGSGSAPGASHSANTASKSTYKVKVKIPSASANTSSSVRRAKFVSASVQSIVVQIFSGQTQLVQGADYVNVAATGQASSGSGDCITSSGVTSCEIDLNASIGSGGNDTVVVATYDAAQSTSCTPSGTPACSGNLLSVSSMPQNVTPGGVINVTLGGIPAYLQPVELVSGYISANNSDQITVYGPGPQVVSFEFLDADKNVIIGAGAPTVTAANNTASTLTTSVTTNGSGLYSLHLSPVTTMVGGLPVVQAGTVTPLFAVTIPGTTLSATVALPIIIAHSILYVSGGSGVESIYVYFDGNTTPQYSVYNTGYAPLNIATDINGNVWGADYGNNKIVEFSAQPASPPSENDANPSPTSLAEPYSIGFDSSGHAYVGNGSPYGVVQYAAPSPQSTPNFGTTTFTYSSVGNLDPQGVAFNESNANLYVSYYNTTTYLFSLASYMSGSSSATTLYPASATTTNGVAIDPLQGDIWFVAGSSVLEINPSGTQVASIAGVSAAGIATDSLGNVFVTNSGGGIKEYMAPSFSSPATIGSVVSPLSVAVYPNAMIGQHSPVGVLPNPTPSPIPIPTPS